jgi:hypothetical protein
MNRIAGMNGSNGLGDLGKAKKPKDPTPAQIAKAEAAQQVAAADAAIPNKVYLFAALAIGGALALYFWNRSKK